MRELIIRLSTNASDAASALRVIDHFDTLVDQRASAAAMLRAAAALTDCTVGFEDAKSGSRLQVDARGATVDPAQPAPATRQTEQFEGLTVWLDREGQPWPLDHLVLERLARSMHAVKRTREADPAVAAIRAVCDPDASLLNRKKALRYLDLGPTVTVVASYAGHFNRNSMPPGMQIDKIEVRLVRSPPPEVAVSAAAPIGFVTCQGVDVNRMWQQAVLALRVAIDCYGRPAHINYAILGSTATIIEKVDARTASETPDVVNLNSIRATKPWAVPTIDAVLSNRSLREAARQQHVHHSTLRQRVECLEEHLRFPLSDLPHYARAATMLTLWRISAAASLIETIDRP